MANYTFSDEEASLPTTEHGSRQKRTESVKEPANDLEAQSPASEQRSDTKITQSEILPTWFITDSYRKK